LSGSGEEGANGVRAIKKIGGMVIVQDEATSAYYGMPQAAALTGCVDLSLPLDEIPQKLIALMNEGADR
jgi:chemotaxis response regulator CheB